MRRLLITVFGRCLRDIFLVITGMCCDRPSGHGRSSGDTLTSIEAMSDWVVSVLDHFSIESIALVGHSMGSLITLETAAKIKARASKVVLIGSIAPMPVSEPILDATANKPGAAHAMLTSFGFSKQNLMGGNPNPGMWMVSDSMRRYEDEIQPALDLDMRACNAYRNGLEGGGNHCGKFNDSVRCGSSNTVASDENLTVDAQ